MSESHNEHEFSDDDDQSVIILERKRNDHSENDEEQSDNNSGLKIDDNSNDDDDTSVDKLAMIHIIYEMKQDINDLKKALEIYRREGKKDLERVISMIKERAHEEEHNEHVERVVSMIREIAQEEEPVDTTNNQTFTKRQKKG